MPDRLPARRSALADHVAPGDIGVAPGAAPGLTVQERRGLAIVQLDAWADETDSAIAAVAEAVGVRPDATPLSAAVSGETAAHWLGPGRWQIVEPEGRRGLGGLMAALQDALAGHAALTDQGHGRACLRISGPALADVLASGSTLDFDPGGDFDPGRAVTTRLGHFAVTAHRIDTETADLYVARSFAVDFHAWLTETAAEFGCRVAPPETGG